MCLLSVLESAIMDLKLTQLNIQGFKSFGKEQSIRFGDITIFIGANGSGKSNLMSFFEMVRWMMDKKLAQYVARHGGNKFFSHLEILDRHVEARFLFETAFNLYSYGFALAATTDEGFVFWGEDILGRKKEGEPTPRQYHVNGTRKESDLEIFMKLGKTDAMDTDLMLSFLKNCISYQFQNTSSDAPIRNSGYVNNTGYLMSNGGNLAAFLYGLKLSPFEKYYDRIVRNIKLAYPSFADFILTLNQFNPDNIRLDWRDKDCPPDFRFSPQQLSDGTLRFMALTALLLQPPETIPKVIVIDEPELGLHPTALSILSNMIYTASKYSQIVIATQSTQLLDYFEPEHIRVVEREGSNSIVTEPDKEQLEYWLKDYSLGQIWEKNIIGGRP